MYPPWCTYLVGKEGADFLAQCGTATQHSVDGLPRCEAHVEKWAVTDAGQFGPGYWPLSFNPKVNAHDIADRVFRISEREKDEYQ